MKQTLVLVTPEGIQYVENISTLGLMALEQIAQGEGKEGWVSSWLSKILKSQPDDDVGLLAVNHLDYLDRRDSIGREQAMRVLGQSFSDIEDPLPLAMKAIGTWLDGYMHLQRSRGGVALLIPWVDPQSEFFEFVIVPASNLRVRKDWQKWQSSKAEMDIAVEAAARWKPDWPKIESLGVVRLNPRANQPTTCVAASIHFEGYGAMAIAWPLEPYHPEAA